VFLPDDPQVRSRPLANEVATHEQRNFPIALLTEVHPDQQYDFLSVVAPVFERPNKIAFVVTMSGLPSPMRGAEIERLGRRLREACDRVSEFLMGRQPKNTRASA
jgi:hypothetical protein